MSDDVTGLDVIEDSMILAVDCTNNSVVALDIANVSTGAGMDIDMDTVDAQFF